LIIYEQKNTAGCFTKKVLILKKLSKIVRWGKL